MLFSCTFYIQSNFPTKEMREGGMAADFCPLITSINLAVRAAHRISCPQRFVGHCVTWGWGGGGGAKSHHGPCRRRPWFVPAPATTEQQESSLGPDWALVLAAQTKRKLYKHQAKTEGRNQRFEIKSGKEKTTDQLPLAIRQTLERHNDQRSPRGFCATQLGV